MDYRISKRSATLLAFGLIYLWCSTLIFWIEWYKSEIFLAQWVGISGMILASLSGMASFVYFQRLETKLRFVDKQKQEFEAQAIHWQDQAQHAFLLLENERAKSNSKKGTVKLTY